MELHEGQRGKKQMSWRTVRIQPRKDILLGAGHLILRMARTLLNHPGVFPAALDKSGSSREYVSGWTW